LRQKDLTMDHICLICL